MLLQPLPLEQPLSPQACDESRTVMTASAAMAPPNTTVRGWRIARMAAMMKVSSPNSLTNICAQRA
jgi:hypothetical protein